MASTYSGTLPIKLWAGRLVPAGTLSGLRTGNTIIRQTIWFLPYSTLP